MTELQEISDANRADALALSVRQDQLRLVSTVAQSLAAAQEYPAVSWPRLITDGGEAVGFVMGGFAEDEPFRSVVWKLLIDQRFQGGGYGRFAVEAVADEARRRGRSQLGAFFVPGPDGPEGFWTSCGFEVRDTSGGEWFAARPI